MRLEVSACGVILLLAGCLGPVEVGGDAPRNGWRIFDSAFDGLENAKLVHTTDAGTFDLAWEGASPYGHKAYYESALRANDTLRLAFSADVGPQVTLRLEHLHEYSCDDAGTQPRPTNASVDDERVRGWVLRAPGECVFHLVLKRDIVSENGIHLTWEATTIAFDARDEGPGGGALLQLVASRVAGADPTRP